MSSRSSHQSRPSLPVPGSPSPLRTWLFDAETTDDDDDYSNISFPNRPLTTSTTSTKPGSESEYSIVTIPDPEYGTPSPSSIPNPSPSTPQNTLRAETPVSDLGPEPMLGLGETNFPSLRTEIDLALCHKIRALKHFAHWSYRQISTATGVALSTVYRIAHPPMTPTHKKTRGRHSILRTPQREKLVILATASAENRRKPYIEIAQMAGLTACERTLRRTMASAGYHRRVARKKPFLSSKTRLVCFLFSLTPSFLANYSQSSFP